MVKRLRENRKNKKGFTLVELIVIILVLAAVMVPSVLRYVDKANKANTKSDAATILVDIQAQVADTYADDGVAPTTVTSNGITVDKNATLLKEKGSAKNATYNETDGDVVSFSFQDGKHFIQWSKEKGWSEVDAELT